jgi:hypothetical protein
MEVFALVLKDIDVLARMLTPQPFNSGPSTRD